MQPLTLAMHALIHVLRAPVILCALPAREITHLNQTYVYARQRTLFGRTHPLTPVTIALEAVLLAIMPLIALLVEKILTFQTVLVPAILLLIGGITPIIRMSIFVKLVLRVVLNVRVTLFVPSVMRISSLMELFAVAQPPMGISKTALQ